MSIETLKRLSLVGLERQKTEVLDRLQSLGCLHLIPLTPAPKEPEFAPPQHAVDARKALRYLIEEPQKRRQVRLDASFDMAAKVGVVLENKNRLRQTLDLRDSLAQRVQELAPWGDFTLPPEADLGGRKLWFYIVPAPQMKQLAQLTLPWQVVHKDSRQSYVVVIDPDEPATDALPTPRTHAGSLSLSAVRRQLDAAELAIEDIEAERRTLTRWIHLMATHLAQAEDAATLRYAAAQTIETDGLFAIQGWVGAARVAELEALAERQGLALLVEDPGPDAHPPTLLANPERLAAGEDLVEFYQMPAYQSWDPSLVVFFSFAAFFAMILSDAGYAVVLGLLLLGFWRRLGGSHAGRRFRVLASVLVGSSLAWGIVVGSYFGIAPAPETLLSRLKLLDINDFDTMMRLSVGVGVAHLAIGNAQRSLRLWPSLQALAPVGWILALLGGYSLWLGLGAAAPGVVTLSQWVTGIGLAMVFLTDSARPLKGGKAVLLRGVDGLMALTQVTKIFGDTLSYLRLFALGLASASLALTFNDLARQVGAQVPGLGLLLELLLLLAGHTLNLLLGLMSGVVHGLRLNYIELYNWALLGEGYPFRPFKKTELIE